MNNCLDIFKGYIKTLGQKLALRDIEIDQNNDCYLAFDEKYFVKCSIYPEKEQIGLFAYIGAIPGDKAIYYRELLESNHFGKDTAGANLSIDPLDGTLLLSYYRDMNFLNDELFYKTVEAFVNAMEHWETKRLAEWVLSSEDSPATASSFDSNMMMLGA